jgi:hypothetical protein
MKYSNKKGKKMNEAKEIILELNNIRAKKYHDKNNQSNHILLDKYYKKIANLINDRIIEVDHYKQQGFDIDNINEVKMHDAILVYGNRGNGKSTVMINLQDFITGNHSSDETKEKLKNKVKIFETIDPTIQEEDEDFLLVMLSTVLKEVESHQEDRYSKRDGFYDSLENVLKIVEATRSKNKDNIDIFDKFYGLKSGVGLAEELHNLFKYTKDIFGVEILVIPIDDVDMNLKQGYQIAESIRKYMSSPYIIPIVAFNIQQMRVVTKFNKYKEFGLKIDKEIKLEELSFLRSLPNDYLSKVFPPNRRIYLKSVYEILEEANEDKKIIIFRKNEDLQLKSFNMASLVSELFYESHYNPKGFDDSTFLSTRSMRNFLNDCYCVLASLNKKKKSINEYIINRKIIKDRLAPDDIPSFVTKEHALTWIWNEYIKLAEKNLANDNNLLKNYNWAKMVTETLPEDNSAEVINKKTYARIWLQEYYVTDECIKKENKKEKVSIKQNREYIHEKKCDIVGALELAMRSYIPMYLFERIVRNRNIEYENSDLIYLKSFSSRSLQGIAYELSMMEATLMKEGYSTYIPKPIGSIVVNEDFRNKTKSVSDKEFNIPFLFKVANKDKLGISESENQQIYILSIFKAIALFIELSKAYRMYQDEENEKKSINKREIILKNLIEKYRVNLPTIINAVNMKEEYYTNRLKGEKSSPCKQDKDILKIDFTDSNFGVLEIATFSKRLVDFFMNVRDNIPEDRLSFEQSKSKEDIEFHSPIITYFTSFTQALFLSLFNSIKKDDILSIKSNNEKDEIIFRKNSLYGTDENNKIPKAEQDHLYQENICNLRNIVNNNNSNDKKVADIQESFNELFKYMNNDIPFFTFLIDEAKFLTKIKD